MKLSKHNFQQQFPHIAVSMVPSIPTTVEFQGTVYNVYKLCPGEFEVYGSDQKETTGSA